MESIIPIEIGMPTIQPEILEKAITEAIAKDLDTNNELWEVAAVDECPKTLITNLGFSEIRDRFHMYMTVF